MSVVSNRFGQSVPDVFIGNIRISKGYDSIKERENTRNNRVTSDRRTSDRYNDDFASRVKSEEGSQLIVTVNLYIKEVVNSSQRTSWFNGSKISRNLKIRVVQSLSEASTKEISRAPRQIYPGGYYDNISKTAAHGAATSVICKDIPLRQSNNFKIENYLTTETSDYRVYDIPYQIIFSIPNDAPPHLTYFAACYYDPNLTDGNRNKRSKIPLLSSLGRLAVEQVINKSKTVKKSKYYSVEDTGDAYFGPIYHKETGEVFTGLTKNTGPNQKLTTKVVPNTKIVDYRIFEKFKKIDISFKDSDKDAIKGSGRSKSRVTYNKKNDDVFFTDLYLNRSQNGVVDMVFGIKMEKIFKNYSHYAKLFQNTDNTIVETILGASKLRKLKIIRRRIDNNKTSFDRLGGVKMTPFVNPDGSYDEHVVVEAYNRPLLTKAGSVNIKAATEDRYTKETVGTIDKIDLSLGSAGDVLFLHISDKQIAKVTEGLYQYGIELDIEDRTQNYLISRLYNFESAIRNYDSLANIARMAGYNKYNKKYTQSFMSVSSLVNYSSSGTTPWSNLITQFVQIINLFMGHNSALTEELQSNLVKSLFSLSCPISNNPKDMDFVMTMMIECANKIRSKMLFDSNDTRRKKITSALRTKKEASPKVAVFKLEKYFGASYKGYSNNNVTSEIVNASLDPNYGYDYFDSGDSAEGLKTYNASDIISRSQIETLRYYKSEDPVLSLKVDDKIYTNRDFALSNKYQFFAPSFVTLGGNKKLNLIDEEENIFNKNKNTALLLDIMGYNMAQEENNMTDYTRYSYSQKLDSYLAFRDVNRVANRDPVSELESSNYNIADDYFGKTTKIIINKDITDDQEIIDMINRESDSRYKSNNNNLRRGAETQTAGTGIMLSLLGAHYLKTLEPVKDLERWNLRNPENIIAFLDGVKSQGTSRSEVIDTSRTSKLQKRQANQVSPEKQRIIKEMPMQLKSLLHQGVGNVSKNNFRRELFASNFNPLQDASKFIMFWLMHGQLVELQAYVGHSMSNNDANMKMPSWRPVTPDVWSNIVNRSTTLCRLVRYRNPMLLGTYPETLDLPIYNEYFIIRGNTTAPGKDSKLKTRISKRVQKVVRDADKTYRSGIQPEYMFNSQIRSGRTSIERKNRPRPADITSRNRDSRVGSAESAPQPQRGNTPRSGGNMGRGTGGNRGGGGY